jgi:Ca2+-binding RTX toxin-like protein
MRRIAVLFILPVTIVLAAPSAQAVAYCDGQVATIVGTSASETIYGTVESDVIFAGGGDDIVFGGPPPPEDHWYGDQGDDRICGGLGNDSITGDAGRDRLIGGAGNDSIIGGPLYDYLFGGGGADYLEDDDEGGISDIFYGAYYSGGPGPDRILAGTGWVDRPETVFGGPGDDRIRVYNFIGKDTIAAGAGNDVVNSVDLNTRTLIDDCIEYSCTRYEDVVKGGFGIDTLTHDGDTWTSFETTTQCAWDPDNNWDRPCGSIAV